MYLFSTEIHRLSLIKTNEHKKSERRGRPKINLPDCLLDEDLLPDKQFSNKDDNSNKCLLYIECNYRNSYKELYIHHDQLSIINIYTSGGVYILVF